jgi:catechol 2,3-dioxygenase-like lactoylglutathione lyase family enzyme
VLLCFLADATKNEQELPSHGAYGQIHFAFEVSKEEYPNAFLQVKKSGIEILHEHLWKNGLRSFYFHDPDSHLVEIIEQGLWEQ